MTILGKIGELENWKMNLLYISNNGILCYLLFQGMGFESSDLAHCILFLLADLVPLCALHMLRSYRLDDKAGVGLVA